jgi:hypothetical protein
MASSPIARQRLRSCVPGQAASGQRSFLASAWAAHSLLHGGRWAQTRVLVSSASVPPWRVIRRFNNHPTGFRITWRAGAALLRDGTSLAHGVRSMRLLGSAGQCWRPDARSAVSQQSNTDQQMALRIRWSSRTSARIATGSWSRCHQHSRRPARSPSPSGAAARAAMIA